MSQNQNNPIPASLQKAIDEFFEFEGSAKDADRTIFNMMQMALTAPDPVNSSRPYDFTAIYDSLRTLLTELESHSRFGQAQKGPCDVEVDFAHVYKQQP